MDFLLSEYVREFKPQFIQLPKDYVEIKGAISAVDKDGNTVIKDVAIPSPDPSNKGAYLKWLRTQK